MTGNIEQVKLLAIRDGTYTIYVFQNIIDKKYIMCTRLPNWQTPNVTVGDIGFLEYQEVKAGESYFDPKTEKEMKYLYSNVYFLNFVHSTNISQNNEIIL